MAVLQYEKDVFGTSVVVNSELRKLKNHNRQMTTWRHLVRFYIPKYYIVCVLAWANCVVYPVW